MNVLWHSTTRARQAEDYGFFRAQRSLAIRRASIYSIYSNRYLLSTWTAYRNNSQLILMYSTRAQQTTVVHGYKREDEYEAFITWY
jgi:hypothetical protein